MNTGYKLPTSIIQNAIGVNEWKDSNNILLVDDKFAYTSGSTNILTVGNFLFNIPQDNVISNFTVRVRGYRGAFNTTLQIYAVDDTTGVELSYPMTPFQGFSGTNTSYELASTTFGTTWTIDQANNLKIKLIADGELYMDSIEVDVNYLPSTTPVPPSPTLGQLVVDEFVQGQKFQLAKSMTSQDTSFFLQSLTYPDGTPIQIGEFHGDAMMTIDQGVSGVEENIEITNIEHNYNGTGLVRVSLSAITNRGLKFKYPYDHDIDLCKDHTGTAEVVISNSAPFYNRFLKRNQADVLFSVPIEVKDNGAIVTPHTHGFDFVGSGVVITTDPLDANKVIVTIAGGGNSTPAVVNVSTGTSGATAVPSITWNHVSSGVDRMLRVVASINSSSSVSGITYNGIAMTLVQQATLGGVELVEYRLIAPPVGTYPIVVSVTPNSVITAGAETWISVDQASPIGALNTATGTSNNPSTSITTTTSASTIADAIATAQTPIVYTTTTPQQIINWKTTANTTARQAGTSYQKSGTAPSSVNMAWNLTTSTGWVHLLSEIKGTPGAGIGIDEKVKVSSGDTTPGFLDAKLVAGSNITLTKLNVGANEQYEISSTGGGGGQAGIQFKDEGTNLGTSGTVDTVDFTGSAVTASRTGNTVTVDITAGAGTSLEETVTQTAHGFVVGDWVRSSGTAGQFTKAQADVPNNSQALGVVTTVVSANSFKMVTAGKASISTTGFAIGDVAWLSPTTAGAMTNVQPTTIGQVAKPLGTVIDTGVVEISIERGDEISNSGGAVNIVFGTFTLSATGTSTIAHTLGYIPKRITFIASLPSPTASLGNQGYSVHGYSLNNSGTITNISNSFSDSFVSGGVRTNVIDGNNCMHLTYSLLGTIDVICNTTAMSNTNFTLSTTGTWSGPNTITVTYIAE